MDPITTAYETLEKTSLHDLEKTLIILSEKQNSIKDYNNIEYIKTIKDYNKQSEVIYLLKFLETKLIEYNQTKLLLNDKEFKEMADENLKELYSEVDVLNNKILILTRRALEDDDKKAIIEIRPGVGGIEASLFAEDLFRMYLRYCNIQHIKVENYSIEYNLEGGINEAVFLVNEDNSFSNFRFESGVHRVQRVPTTEALGRIHTSTASVVALPKVDYSSAEISPSDIRIDVYRSSGPGGQSVNTTDSAVRITHLPTKITVTCQEGKSQHKNKEIAMSILMSKLYEIDKEKKEKTVKTLRAESIKGGDRSSKIRTYNFSQGRITDHRINKSWFNIDKVMEGYVGDIIYTTSNILRSEFEKSA